MTLPEAELMRISIKKFLGFNIPLFIGLKSPNIKL